MSVQDPMWQEDILTNDFRCGRSAFGTGNLTDTATVVAGSKIGFAVGGELESQSLTGYIFHQGPLSFWLSRSTVDNLSRYTGDGEWFKIGSVTGRTKDSPELRPNAPKYSAMWGMYWAESVSLPPTFSCVCTDNFGLDLEERRSNVAANG